jgi:hypothetical protein
MQGGDRSISDMGDLFFLRYDNKEQCDKQEDLRVPGYEKKRLQNPGQRIGFDTGECEPQDGDRERLQE